MTVPFLKGRYRVRMAEGAQDIAACQALRHACFYGRVGLDVDAFDLDRSHVMVMDGDALAGTCRVKCYHSGADICDSYAAQRYDLSQLFAYDASLMEVGRFCVAPGIAEADVLRLTWGALAQMVDQANVGLIFGCASFSGVDPSVYDAAFSHLAARYLAPAQWAPARRAEEVVPLVVRGEKTQALQQLPTLLRSYLSRGGWVSDHAVVDRDLGTLHVFTGLEVARIPARRAAALRAIPT